MLLIFQEITQEEKAELVTLATDYPDDVIASEIVAGMDGETSLNVLIAVIPPVITGLFNVICKLLEIRHKNAGSNDIFPIRIQMKNGRQISIKDTEELKKVIKDEFGIDAETIDRLAGGESSAAT